MKAITVRQPWAWAILEGGKDVENRTRNITGSYRGPVVVHAAKAYAADFYGAVELIEMITGVAIPPFDSGHPSELRGVALGIIDLDDVHSAYGCFRSTARGCSAWAEVNTVQHLRLAGPRLFPQPIPYRGALGLWEFPDELLPEGWLR